MSRTGVSDVIADRLLRGGLAPDDAPPGYSGLTRLFRVAAGPGEAGELAQEETIVAAMARAWALGPEPGDVEPPAPRRVSRSVRRIADAADAADAAEGATAGRRRLSAGVALAGVATVVLLGGGVAAAATGSLPGPVQSALSGALSDVGISIPNPAHHGAASNGHSHNGHSHGSSAGAQTNPGSGNGNSDFGLCTALLAGGGAQASAGHGQSTAMTNLIAAHGGSVVAATTYCQGVVSAHQDNGHGQHGPQGPPSSTPAGTNPSNGKSQGTNGPPSSPPGSTAPGPNPHAGTPGGGHSG